jgi:hypothetical protein
MSGDLLKPPVLGTWWAALLVAAGALAVPLVLHLWRRQRARPVAWAAMWLVREAVRVRQRRARWHERLLLAARVGLLLCVLAAVVLPQPWAQDALAALRLAPDAPAAPPGTRAHRVFVLDGSLSMDARAGGESRFERAKRELAAEYHRQARAGDAFSLVLMAAPPRGYFAAPNEDRDAFARELAALRQTHGPADLPATVALVTGLLERSPEPFTRREVYFLTDLQRATWKPRSEHEAEELARALARLSRLAWVSVVDYSADRPANLAVTGLTADRPLALTDDPVTFTATVRAHGDGPARVRAALWVGGPLAANGKPAGADGAGLRLQGQQEVVLADEEPKRSSPPGPPRPAQVQFRHRFPAPGTYIVQVRLDADDGLAPDDQRSLIVTVRDRLPVLLVDGTPFGPAEERETHYLRHALANPRRRVRVEVVSPWRLAQQPLGSADSIEAAECVVLCNVPRLAERELRRLDDHLRHGGGLIVFLSDQVEPGHYNEQLYRRGQGPLPVEILPADQQLPPGPRRLFVFDPHEYRHPLLHAFQAHTDAGLLTARFWRYTRVRAAGEATVILSFIPAPPNPPRTTASAAGPDDPTSLPAIAPEAPAGDPAVVEATRHKGRVFVVTTGANLKWTSWPLNPSYVPLTQELLLAAVAGRTQARSALVGDPLEAWVGAGREVVMLTPDGRQEPIAPPEPPAAPVVRFEPTEQSGLYRLTGVAGTAPNGDFIFAVNIADDDRGEGRPERLAAADLRALYPDWWFTHDTRCRIPRSGADEGPVNLARLCLLGGVFLLLAELLLAWRSAAAR